MGDKQVSRSQKGARAEAHRRIAERTLKAEAALAAYLRAGKQIESASELIAQHEATQRKALAELAAVIGREQAAATAGVDVKLVPAAGRRGKALTGGGDSSIVCRPAAQGAAH
jgi:outer membrane protein TolC